jgi:hypothetical protein
LVNGLVALGPWTTDMSNLSDIHTQSPKHIERQERRFARHMALRRLDAGVPDVITVISVVEPAQ